MKSKIKYFSLIFFLISTSSYSQFRLSDAFPNLTTPFIHITEMIPSNDGTNRIFVVTQSGVIYVFYNSPTVTTAKVFLNLSDSVTQSGGETGLLGLAFHPHYLNNQYFYIDYTTRQLPLRSKISRFITSPSNPDSAVRSSELVIMTVNQPYANHNGGKIAFGPNGYLYIGFGDGGSEGDPQNNAQNRQVLLGKLLRINIDSAGGGNNYSIPVTNPYYRNTQGYREEIWAYGLRNPWRFSFDTPNNRMWTADVGEDLYEEIDIILPGKNYGWRIMEGFHCFNPPEGCDTTGLTLPIREYSHSFGCSITGGYVYHGSSAPFLTGKYIYGDYCSGIIWALSYDGINLPVNELVAGATNISISTFGLDQNNEEYVCSYTSTGGRIFKIVPDPACICNNLDHFPQTLSLKQNYPNPFKPATIIKFDIPQTNSFMREANLGQGLLVHLIIYDILGREIQTLVNGELTPGSYEVPWYAGNYPSGIYFCRLSAGTQILERKMVLVK